MQLTPRLQECQDCQTLKNLLVQVDCSLQNLLRNRLNTENFNVETYFCNGHAKTLAHYKRILTKRIYNPTYMCDIESQDIIALVRKVLFGTCANCIKCDDATSTTTTIDPTTTTTTTLIPT